MSQCPTYVVIRRHHRRSEEAMSRTREEWLEEQVERLRELLEAANIYGAGENAARLNAEAERDALRANIETMRQAALIDDWHTFDAAIDAARRER